MKSYIRIETTRKDELKTVSIFLLTDNVTGFTYEANETKLFFLSSNPFSYARLHLTDVDFMALMTNKIQQKTATVSGSVFHYSIVKM